MGQSHHALVGDVAGLSQPQANAVLETGGRQMGLGGPRVAALSAYKLLAEGRRTLRKGP